MYFGNRIRELRENKGLLQRELAASLEIDTPMFSKIERSERIPKKHHVVQLAHLLGADEKELLTIWLADQVYRIVKNEDYASNALEVAMKHLDSK